MRHHDDYRGCMPRPIIVLIAALALAGCGTTPPDPVAGAITTQAPTTEPPAATTVTTVAADPFDVYLSLAPADAPEMTRDDAQARALIGCSSTWAPGTVDAALQQAYAELIDDWRSQGMCG